MIKKHRKRSISATTAIKENLQTYQRQKQPPKVFCKKGVLINFAKFIVKHLCQSLFFNKVAGLRPETLLKRRLWHRCFPMNIAKFLRTPFLENTSGRLFCKGNPDIIEENLRLRKSNCQNFCEFY